MRRTLGEILVAGAKLDPADLRRALDAQLISGGRLGTNLVEMGLLDEATLSRALAEQASVEVATSEMFDAASLQALRLVPPRVADRHKVVALSATAQEVCVAMLDPTDPIVLDELTFTTGRSVRAYIAPEVRLLAYLERYYGIPRPLRFMQRPPDRAEPPRSSQPAPPTDVSRTAARPADSSRPVADMGAGVVDGRPSPGGSGRVRTLEEACRLLAQAETREEIGEVLVAFAHESFERVVAFVVQGDRALGWLAAWSGPTPPSALRAVRAVAVPLDRPSVLQSVARSALAHVGEPCGGAGDEALAAVLGPPRPSWGVVLPVKLEGRVALLVHADAAARPPEGVDARPLGSACEAAGLALEVLRLRARIRQTA